MLIQSTDGFFYIDPVILGHRWVLFVEDNNVLLARKGRVTWSTARRDLPKAGIRSKLIAPAEDRKIVIGEEYVKCSIFKIKLLKPIPPTNQYQGRTQHKPEDEEVLSWT